MSYIELENVSLTYPVYGANARSIKTSILNITMGGRLNRDSGKVEVEALKNLNFQLNKGDRLAILGHNGAGKSSLLKVLAQIYTPTSGVIKIKGRTNCLFDIMMGMDCELNAYENIILRGLIIGLSKKEALRMIPQIEAFAELGDFIKMPLKTYSSGMKVRLAFGIITGVFSEILLIDEIINVGDSQFVEKAKKRVASLVHQSDIMVLSTHDTHIIKEFCNKALLLEKGVIKCMGSIEEVLKTYNLENATDLVAPSIENIIPPSRESPVLIG